MNNSLTWKELVELRTPKANKFFHQFKRNTSYLLTVTAKLNKLIPVLTYGSNFYMPSKFDMRLLEKFREKYLKRTLQNLIYCKWIRSPNLLPLKYYIVLTDHLLLSKFVKNYYAYNISEHINIVQRRSSLRFVLPEIKKVQRSNFFYWTTYRANIIESNFKFLQPVGL